MCIETNYIEGVKLIILKPEDKYEYELDIELLCAYIAYHNLSLEIKQCIAENLNIENMKQYNVNLQNVYKDRLGDYNNQAGRFQLPNNNRNDDHDKSILFTFFKLQQEVILEQTKRIKELNRLKSMDLGNCLMSIVYKYV